MSNDANLELVASRFPHIGKPLNLLWGHREVVTYADKLFRDTRGGTRRGFHADVMLALAAIREAHLALGGNAQLPVQSATTPWGSGGRRGRW